MPTPAPHADGLGCVRRFPSSARRAGRADRRRRRARRLGRNRLFIAKLASRGGRLVSFQLKNYRTTIDPESPPLEIVDRGRDLPLGVDAPGRSDEVRARSRLRAVDASTSARRRSGSRVAFRGKLPDGGTIEKTLRFRRPRYEFEVALDIGGAGTREAGLAWAHKQAPPSKDQHWVGTEALIDKKLVYLEPEQLTEGAIYPNPRDPSAANATVQWAGYADSYFLSAIAPNVETSVRAWMKLQQDIVTTEVLVPLATVQQDAPEYTVYVGPKDLEHLTPPGRQLHRALDLGWFSFVAEPMLRAAQALPPLHRELRPRHHPAHGARQVLFMPLTQKSFQSMQGMQKLQPQMKRLREKFKDDREAMNKEMMELYRRHKVNPLGGCLPMVLQMPVFIGLYNALSSRSSCATRRSRSGSTTSPRRTGCADADRRAIGTSPHPVLTLLMGVSMLMQQRMTPPAGDPTQQKDDDVHAVIFTVMFIDFPSGLSLYWLVNNVLTIAQQAA